MGALDLVDPLILQGQQPFKDPVIGIGLFGKDLIGYRNVLLGRFCRFGIIFLGPL
jgi:hypothetical protein